ncbi:MAG: hypothetical protein ACXVGO_15515 [Mycobacterium sp.]
MIAAMFLLGFASPAAAQPHRAAPADDDYWDHDDDIDDDHYVEFTVSHHEAASSVAVRPAAPVTRLPQVDDRDDVDVVDEDDTEPMAARHAHLLTPPATTWHDEPVEPPAVRREPVRSLHDFLADVPPQKPSVEPIGFAHNGFHVDHNGRFQPLGRFEAGEDLPSRTEPSKPDILSPDYPLEFGSHAYHESPDAGFDRGLGLEPRHGLGDDEPQTNGRHSRADSDDVRSRGRHSRPGD